VDQRARYPILRETHYCPNLRWLCREPRGIHGQGFCLYSEKAKVVVVQRGGRLTETLWSEAPCCAL